MIAKMGSLSSSVDAASSLLDVVERVTGGEEITITQKGIPVAVIVPFTSQATANERRDAISQMKSLMAKNQLGGMTIRELRDEGRW